MAERIADPIRQLTRATGRIARGDFDARIAVRSSDELRRLVDAFNSMAAELKAQRDQLERTHRLEAWAEMARQVAHEIKNPLTPIQLSAEHLRRVHADRGEPLGAGARRLRDLDPRPGPAAPADLVGVLELRVVPDRAPRRRGLPRSWSPKSSSPTAPASQGRIAIDNEVAAAAAAGARRSHARRAARSRTSSRTRCTRCRARGSIALTSPVDDGWVVDSRRGHRRRHG